MIPEIYHVTPITPNPAMRAICVDDEGKPRPRNFLVSMHRDDQLELALELGSKVLTDHGRFSSWVAAKKAGKEWCEDDVPRPVYYAWLEPFIWRPNVKAIMPDIPGAPAQINDGELKDWPFPVEKGLPVYHMNTAPYRLGRLLETYPLVCMGWIPAVDKTIRQEPVGCDAYWRCVEAIEDELGSDIWEHVHMLRGVAVANDGPFASADASSGGQNGHRYDSPIDEFLGDKWRGRRAYFDALERHRPPARPKPRATAHHPDLYEGQAA